MSVCVCVSYIVSLPKKPHLNERQSSGKWRGQGNNRTEGQWDRYVSGRPSSWSRSWCWGCCRGWGRTIWGWGSAQSRIQAGAERGAGGRGQGAALTKRPLAGFSLSLHRATRSSSPYLVSSFPLPPRWTLCFAATPLRWFVGWLSV